jgi:N-acyl-phosphatidylethanolamine-hydrolysing phospholipase D
MRNALLAVVFALTAAVRVFGQPAPHGPDGYHNNYPHGERRSFWAWKWEQLRDGLPKAPPGGWNLPTVRTDAAALSSLQTNRSMTWIGHATILVRLGGKNILFDPVFSERPSPVPFAGPKRVVPLPIDIEELPQIDIVLISHNHYDHLDADSVRRFAAMPARSPRSLVPLGVKAWFAEHGVTISTS